MQLRRPNVPATALVPRFLTRLGASVCLASAALAQGGSTPSLPSDVFPSVLPEPEISLSPMILPLGDGHQTTVTLTAHPFDSTALATDVYELTWIVPGATFVEGTDPSSPVARVTFAGDEPALIELRVAGTQPDGLFVKDTAALGLDIGSAVIHGDPHVWQPVELWFRGPTASMLDDAPNPFLDYRMDVRFLRPDGSTWTVPGFFDGDGAGGGTGDVWKVRFSPDQPGLWRYQISFRSGQDVAVAADGSAGDSASIDGQTGEFEIRPVDRYAEGFHRFGPLTYAGTHYLQFANGTWFLKGGTNSPENLLAFRGFEDVQDQGGKGIVHEYAPHLDDFTIEDPLLPESDWDGAEALVGALNYLNSVGVNSIYFLPMNLGGDAQDTVPFTGYQKTAFDKTHYHVGRLLQWNTVFEHAQRKEIMLHFVLAETELANETWLDEGQLGTERKLYFRELVARFSHHPAIKWNLSEENSFSGDLIVDMAQWLRDLDPYDHPITAHTPSGDFWLYNLIKGDPLFEATSIQYPMDKAGEFVEKWRTASTNHGQPWVVDMDENGTASIGASDANADDMRKRILYDVYFSGGQIEWYLGGHPLPVGGDSNIEDFRTREELWTYTRLARGFLELLPFWKMVPADDLLSGESADYGGGEVFALPGELYAVYLPNASQGGSLDLGTHAGTWEFRWFNPRTGLWSPATRKVLTGGAVPLGQPGGSVDEDWVLLLRRLSLYGDKDVLSAAAGGVQQLTLDGGLDMAGAIYLLLGTTTGVQPGIPLNKELKLDLNPDPYFWYTLFQPGLPPLAGSVGLLDQNGRATATFAFPPGGISGVDGMLFYHAWISPIFPPTFASNPEPLYVGP